MSGLSIRDLCVARGGIPVLEGVSLDVGRGEVAFLKGPNGIGKTTLLRCIAGLAPPVSGTVEGAGPNGELAAFAGHADAVKPTLTVRENLAFWASIQGVGTNADRAGSVARMTGAGGMGTAAEGERARSPSRGRGAEAEAAAGIPDAVTATLEAYRLLPLAERRAGTLSAGQKRRLGLSRLLLDGRPVWLLDEPTTSLDTRAKGLFAAALASRLATGGSALVATHVDLGVPGQVIDLEPFRAREESLGGIGGAFA